MEANTEVPLIKDKLDVNFKLISKNGEQAKDEGINHMCFSLGESNNDYISYLRGKTNIV